MARFQLEPGVKVFDFITRRAMMEAVHRMSNGDVILFFICNSAALVREGEEGVVREIQQGEGQGH